MWIAHPLLGLVDTAVVGKTASAASGGVELAALGAATLVIDYSSFVLTAALSTATVVLTARALANGASVRAAQASRRVAATATYVSLAVALAFGVPLFFGAETWLSLVIPEHSRELLIAPAASYVRLRAIGEPAAFLETVLQAYFLGRKDAITPLVVTLLAFAVNLVLDLVLCLGLNMGIAGAAAASSAAQIVAAGYIAWHFVRTARADRAAEAAEAAKAGESQQEEALFAPPSRESVVRYCSVGVPTAMVVLAKVLTYGSLTAAATRVSTLTAAAHTVATNVFFLFAVFGDAVSSVATSAMPSHLGRPSRAFRFAGLLLLCGACVGLFNSMVSTGIATIGAGAFTSSAAVVEQVRTIVPLMGVALLLHAFSMATEGVLFAGSQMRFMVASYFINCGLAVASLSYLTQHHAAMGLAALTGIWLVKVQFQVVRIALNGTWLLGPWSTLRQEGSGATDASSGEADAGARAKEGEAAGDDDGEGVLIDAAKVIA